KDGHSPHCRPRPPRLHPRIMWNLANPTRFMALSAHLMPWCAGAAALLLATGLYMGWFLAPADYQQGETVRIMFLHVPAAWLGVFFYGLMGASPLRTLAWAPSPPRTLLH